MKLFTSQSSLFLFSIGFFQQVASSASHQSWPDSTSSQSMQSRLVDRCCKVGRERAIESSKFNCKLSAHEALIAGQPARSIIVLSAEAALSRDPTFADQCEMVLESCCMSHHRAKNCESGKQLAKSGASCMDVELSKETSVATESFNDCCMSCSLGILAGKNPGQNETSAISSRQPNLAARCKLISPLASSLSGQLYEQTYIECCRENLPKLSSTLVEPDAPIDCLQSNPCSQRCVQASNSFDSSTRRRVEADRCDCFTGYKLAPDGVTCVDIDECKLNLHTCNKMSEVCDNTRGSFRCLARSQNQLSETGDVDFVSEVLPASRICPTGTRWNSIERQCLPVEGASLQRSASLFASSSSSSSSHKRSSSAMRTFDS